MSFEKSSANFEGSRINCVVKEGSYDELSTITETWFVSRKRSGSMTPLNMPYDFETLRADTGGPIIPVIGTGYPTGTGATWQDAAALRSVDISPSGKGAVCTLSYSTRYFYTKVAKGLARTVENIASATTLTAGLFLRASRTTQSRTRSSLAYRTQTGGYTSAVNASIDASISDIGGTALGGSRGQQVDVKQFQIKVRLVVDTEITGQDLDSLEVVLLACIGRNNSQPFLGWPARTVICEGGSLNHLEGEFYEFVLDFLWDEWAHFTQVPEMGADGRPKLSGGLPSDVRWRRDIRTSVDFNDIWPANDLGKSYKYQTFRGTPF
jgi:hypothetical protein